jgi:site-specific recombinase XerD
VVGGRKRETAGSMPVFAGLAGARLQPTILANIITRAARRTRIDKRARAHTLRHTAATWLRQTTGDARLVAEYLGDADLSTVSRYAHVARAKLHNADRRHFAVIYDHPLQGHRNTVRTVSVRTLR